MEIIRCHFLPRVQKVVRQETLLDRQAGNFILNFLFGQQKKEYEDSPVVYWIDGKLVAHPSIADALVKEYEKQSDLFMPMRQNWFGYTMDKPNFFSFDSST